MFKAVLCVGIGGAAGSILRYLCNVFVAKYYEQVFPMATLLVNVLGCLLIGILAGYFESNTHRELQFLLITGFCGGYTTFSTFSMETYSLLQHHGYLSLLYVLLSVVLGLLAVVAGLAIGKAI